jgi:hypothetical protein
MRSCARVKEAAAPADAAMDEAVDALADPALDSSRACAGRSCARPSTRSWSTMDGTGIPGTTSRPWPGIRTARCAKRAGRATGRAFSHAGSRWPRCCWGWCR